MEKVASQLKEKLVSDEVKDSTKKTAITLGAGIVAGTVSSLAIAPLSTIGDIQGSQGRDPESFFYNKKMKEVASHIYQQGKAKEVLRKGHPEIFNSLGVKNTPWEKADPVVVVKDLREKGQLIDKSTGLGRGFRGIKEFYGGQGLKSLRVGPQNALNFAIFTGISAALTNKLIKKPDEQNRTV